MTQTTENLAFQFQMDLFADKDRLEYIMHKQNLTLADIKEKTIGFCKSRRAYSLPIVDFFSGKEMFQYYYPQAVKPQPKYKFHKGLKKQLVGWECLGQFKTVYLTAGYFKMMILNRMDLPAFFISTGESSRLDQNQLAMLENKKVIIVYDNDIAGRTGATKIAQQLAFQSSPYIVKWPQDAPDKCDPNDWLRIGNSEDSLRQIIYDAEEFIPEREERDEETINDLMKKYGSMVVVGENDNGSICLFSTMDHRYRNIHLNTLNVMDVIKMTGLDCEKGASGELHELKKAVAYKSIGKYTSNYTKKGQGIWPHKDGLIIVNGNRGYYRDREGVAPIKDIIFDKSVFLDLKHNMDWVDNDWIMDTEREVDGEDLYNRLKKITSKWNYKHEEYAELLVGLIIAAPFQTTWHWRPHIFLTGPRAAGKTSLFSFLRGVYGAISLSSDDVSAPGVYQHIQNTSMIPLFDEFEKNKKAVLNLIRSSNTGGKIIRGNTEGTGTEYELHQMFWISAINFNLKEGADISRYIKIEILPPKRLIFEVTSMKECLELRRDILQFGFNNYFRYKEVTEQIEKYQSKNIPRRVLDNFSVPISVLATLRDEPFDRLIDKFMFIKEEIDYETDEERLLDDILNSIISYQHDREHIKPSIRKTLFEDAYYRSGEVNLEGIGIARHITPKNVKGFTLHPRTFYNAVFKNNEDWRSINIKDMLLRLPGTTKRREEVGEKKSSEVIFVPFDYVEGDEEIQF